METRIKLVQDTSDRLKIQVKTWSNVSQELSWLAVKFMKMHVASLLKVKLMKIILGFK